MGSKKKRGGGGAQTCPMTLRGARQMSMFSKQLFKSRTQPLRVRKMDGSFSPPAWERLSSSLRCDVAEMSGSAAGSLSCASHRLFTSTFQSVLLIYEPWRGLRKRCADLPCEPLSSVFPWDCFYSGGLLLLRRRDAQDLVQAGSSRRRLREWVWLRPSGGRSHWLETL